MAGRGGAAGARTPAQLARRRRPTSPTAAHTHTGTNCPCAGIRPHRSMPLARRTESDLPAICPQKLYRSDRFTRRSPSDSVLGALAHQETAMPKSKRDKTGARRACRPARTQPPRVRILCQRLRTSRCRCAALSPPGRTMLLSVPTALTSFVCARPPTVSLTRTEKKGRQLKNKLIEQIRDSIDECVCLPLAPPHRSVLRKI